ncbi:MAG: glycosyltransferase [Chlorobi bacterium]|nr:glycosyltransferase [Chlorobiota bacterium]MCI0716203.1 glycosyltransferase [Chlorobiota bacterium]
MIDISVIIVNYNVKELLHQCVSSVLSSSKNLNCEVIIIDNNSFDGSVEFIKSRFSLNSKVKIICSPVNLGFANGNNLAAKEAKGEYLLILNPDTVLQEDTLEKTLSFYKSSPQAGAVTCKLVLPSGKLDLACRRSFPTPNVALYRLLGLSKLFPKSRLFGRYNLTFLDENQTYEVDAIAGAFMLIKKDIYEQVGGFDEEYFMYGEDLDLCYRLKKAGYKIYYHPGTSIIHYKGESTKKSSISYVNNFYGAMQIFVRKNLKTRFRLFDFLIKVSIFYRAVMSYFKRIFSSYYPVSLDIIFIVLGMLFAIKQRFETFPIAAYELVIIIYSIIWVVALSISGSYSKANQFSLLRPLNGILIGFFVNSAFTYFFNEFAFSRVVVLRTTLNAYIFLVVWRLIAKTILFSKRKGIFSTTKTLIIGRNEDSERFINKMKKRVDTEYDIMGYISVDGNLSEGYIGNLNNLSDIIAANNVKNIIFAKGAFTNQLMLNLMWSLQNYNLNFKILSDDSDIVLGKSALDKIDDIYLMQIEYNINKKINIFVKRLFDLSLGLLSLVTLYPAVLIITKIMKMGSDRAKFVNKLLLIPSVFSGKLSFVGRATWDTTSYGKQYLGKNGLTGLVQINFHKNLGPEEIEYYNFYYAKNQSLPLDIEILLKTLSLFLFRKNIPKL